MRKVVLPVTETWEVWSGRHHGEPCVCIREYTDEPVRSLIWRPVSQPDYPEHWPLGLEKAAREEWEKIRPKRSYENKGLDLFDALDDLPAWTCGVAVKITIEEL